MVTYRAAAGTGAGFALTYFKTNLAVILPAIRQSSNSHQSVLIVTYRAVAGTGAGSALAYFNTNLAAILPIFVAIGLIESIAS